MQHGTVLGIPPALSVISFGDSISSTPLRTGTPTIDTTSCHHHMPHGLEQISRKGRPTDTIIYVFGIFVLLC